MNKKKDMKYGDDNYTEAWLDANFFGPLSEKLSHPVHKLGLTPNNITFISTLFGLYACYMLYNNRIKQAMIYWLISYIFDCIDGRLARNYNMSSAFGEAFDFVSDMVGNVLLILILLFKVKRKLPVFIVISIISYICMIWHGLCEALKNYGDKKNDNFLKTKEEKFKGNNVMYKIYLMFMKSSYSTYRMVMPKYDESKVYKYLSVVKMFGPGHMTIFFLALIYLSKKL